MIQEYDSEVLVEDIALRGSTDGTNVRWLIRPIEDPYRTLMLTLVNNGNGNDTFSLTLNSSLGPETGWGFELLAGGQERGNQTAVNAGHSQSQTVNLKVTPPTSAEYNWSQVLIDITHGDNDSTQVRVVTELEIPELEIVNFAITTIPVEYRDVTVSLTVVNHGPGRAINSKAIFYFDGEPVATVAIPVLEEGESKVLEASWHVPFGSIGEHELESRVFVGENQVEHEVGNNIYVSRIDVLPNWNIWIPIITALSGYLIILVTSRMAFNSRLSNTLGYYGRVNQKVRLENQLKLIQESQQRVGIMGTLRWSVRAHILLIQAKSEIEHVERIYRQVLDRRDELFNMVSMLKARGLGHLEAEKTLEEVQAELNTLRPEGYEGLEMPDAEKYEGKSIEDLGKVQKELAETLAAEENEEILEAQIIEEDEE
jgi:hypothetical protein